jgi:hypothetical protein
MGNVSDDALRRHIPLSDGLNAIAAAGKRFQSQLQKFDENPPADLELYHTAFKEAKEATSDVIDLGQGDANARAAQLEAKEEQEKRQSKGILRAEDKANPEVAANNPEDQHPERPKRKPPTLLRPGETLPNQ